MCAPRLVPLLDVEKKLRREKSEVVNRRRGIAPVDLLVLEDAGFIANETCPKTLHMLSVILLLPSFLPFTTLYLRRDPCK